MTHPSIHHTNGACDVLCPGRILTLQLQALEEERTVFAEVPPRVKYELTEMVLDLGPILKQLSDWDGNSAV